MEEQKTRRRGRRVIGLAAIGAMTLVMAGCELSPVKKGAPAGNPHGSPFPPTKIVVFPEAWSVDASQAAGGFAYQTFTVGGDGGVANGLAPPTGPLTVALENESGTGDFTIAGDDCTGRILVPHGSCAVTIEYFNDTGAGTGTVDLVVTGSPGGTARATLTGNGVA